MKPEIIIEDRTKPAADTRERTNVRRQKFEAFRAKVRLYLDHRLSDLPLSWSLAVSARYEDVYLMLHREHPSTRDTPSGWSGQVWTHSVEITDEGDIPDVPVEGIELFLKGVE